jgi:hypothetical protein
MSFDAPPNSLKYSNANPKVKTTEEGVGAHSLAHNILRVKKSVFELWSGD